MEQGGINGGFRRPPPTSPKGRPKKKARRDNGPSTHSPHRPPLLPALRHTPEHDVVSRKAKPLFLGDYPVQQRPSQPPLTPAAAPPTAEFKIRGRSAAQPEPEPIIPGGDYETRPQLPPNPTTHSNPSHQDLESSFHSAISRISSKLRVIQLANPQARRYDSLTTAVEGIWAELDPLRDVYHAVAAELEHSKAHEAELQQELDDVEKAGVESREMMDGLWGDIRALKDAIAEREAFVGGLRRQVEEGRREREAMMAERQELEGQFRQIQAERNAMVAERLWLGNSVREKEVEAEEAVKAKCELEHLLGERDREVEGLKADNVALRDLVQQREAETEMERADNLKPGELVRKRNERELSSNGLPMTPLSPLLPLVSFPFPAAPTLPALPQYISPGYDNAASDVYIKQEAPDPCAPPDPLAEEITPAVPSQDLSQQLYYLGMGAADILGKALCSEASITYNVALITFLARLGAAPGPSAIPTTQVTGSWTLEDPWMPDATPPPPTLPPTLEEKFAQLCFLYPFPGVNTDITTTSREVAPPLPESDPEEHQSGAGADADAYKSAPRLALLTSLIMSLIKADHAASPRAGLAFLQTLSALGLHPGGPTTLLPENARAAKLEEGEGGGGGGGGGSGDTSSGVRGALIGIMFAELGRVLRRTFMQTSSYSAGHGWSGGVGAGQSGVVGDGGMVRGAQPLACLGAALRDADGGDGDDGAAAKEQLKMGCGDAFCVVPSYAPALPASASASSSSAAPSRSSPSAASTSRSSTPHSGTNLSSNVDAPIQETSVVDIGLLHCGEGSGCFLVVDFASRSLRLVDCRLASMRPNTAEPRKLDLIVSSREEDELLRVDAAPRELAAFWLKYAMVDV